MKISDLADQVRGVPLRDVLERYGFEVRPEGTTLRAKSRHHNIVVTGARWFDNKAGVGSGGAIDLVIHLAKVNFPAACRSLADEFLVAGQSSLSFPKGWQEPPHPEKKSFEELAAIYAVRDDSNWPIARVYLFEQRKISLSLVDELHARGSIYADDHRPNPSLVCFTATNTARCSEPACGIPNISPYSARALEISLPPGSRWEISPKQTASLLSSLPLTL
jgi:hypothetical protein